MRRLPWALFAIVSFALAAIAIQRWLWAISIAGPVLYGEGAVAHAALLSRDGLMYTMGASALEPAVRPVFTAANYPPLYFRIAGLGDPFVLGRIASIVATIGVAGAIAWRARAGGTVASVALALAWLATFPVVVWGAAVKPDLVALALTVAAVLAVGPSPRRAALAAVLIALAIWTKPTAALPALALGLWCARQGGRTFAGYVAGGVAGLVIASLALMGPGWPLAGGKAFWLHVVTWNALPWSVEQAVLLAVLAATTLGLLIGTALVTRSARGPIAAYAIAAVGIAVLGGREGATINYLLDLSAATALALATVAARLRSSALFALAASAQLVLAVLLFDPVGLAPGRAPTTGAWGDPARIAAVRDLPAGSALVEDSGLLLANGREPIVDDLFLWSRINALANDSGLSFLEGPQLVSAVREKRFVAIVSEADLARISEAPAFERARWHPDLVRAVLEGYALDRTAGGLRVYRPR